MPYLYHANEDDSARTPQEQDRPYIIDHAQSERERSRGGDPSPAGVSSEFAFDGCEPLWGDLGLAGRGDDEPDKGDAESSYGLCVDGWMG